MKISTYIPILLTALIANSCQKEISFEETLDHQSQLFIECILYPGENPKVYLSNTNSFFSEKVTPQEIFAREAIVELKTSSMKDSLVPDSTFDKFRCRWIPYYTGSIIPVLGETYTLTVSYKGNTYTASTTIAQAQVDLDEVEYVEEFFDIYGGHDGVILRFKDAGGEANFYKFQMDRWIDNSVYHAHVLEVITSTCTSPGELFFVSDLGRTVFSDVGSDGQNMELYLEVSFEYSEGDTATIFLQSLDDKSAAFFSDLDDQLQSIINPFVEPTIIHSTIDGTLGVFGSAVRSKPIRFTYPQDNP